MSQDQVSEVVIWLFDLRSIHTKYESFKSHGGKFADIRKVHPLKFQVGLSRQ